jgi:hypothetical protein
MSPDGIMETLQRSRALAERSILEIEALQAKVKQTIGFISIVRANLWSWRDEHPPPPQNSYGDSAHGVGASKLRKGSVKILGRGPMNEPSMPHYRLYFLDKSGHIQRARDLQALSEAEAYKRAELFGEGRDWELWQGPKLIARSDSITRRQEA